MDGTPGLITALAATAASVANALIGRGAAAGSAEVKAALAELRTKATELETRISNVEALPARFAALTAQVNAELQAAARAVRRHATGSQPTISSDDLSRSLGVEDIERRVKVLEDRHEADQRALNDQRDEARRAEVALQRELAKLGTQLDLLLGGKIR